MARPSSKSDSLNGLTPIHQPIHCAATTNGGGPLDEVDHIQINHFLQTLASIALAVASRRVAGDGGGVG